MTKRMLDKLKKEGYKNGQLIHKAAKWDNDRPVCRPNYWFTKQGSIIGNNRNCWVVSQWHNVNCLKCLSQLQTTEPERKI